VCDPYLQQVEKRVGLLNDAKEANVRSCFGLQLKKKKTALYSAPSRGCDQRPGCSRHARFAATYLAWRQSLNGTGKGITNVLCAETFQELSEEAEETGAGALKTRCEL
jgi:hypothetical protein